VFPEGSFFLVGVLALPLAGRRAGRACLWLSGGRWLRFGLVLMDFLASSVAFIMDF